MSDLQRYEAMQGSLCAVKDWFDRHFSIPTFVYVGMTFSYWCQLSHCLLALYRLSIYDDPAWDRRAVRSRIDLFAICDQLKKGFDEVATHRRLAAGPTVEEDTFMKFSRMLRTMKSNWLAELDAAQQPRNPGMPQNPSGVPISLGGNPQQQQPEAVMDSGANGLNVTFFQPDDPDSWIAGLFDINWSEV